uniref:3-oxoacyl-[acyl-carrier-protein] reductase n=1 Tax=Saccoglossus kowalevskii TaxID=10224 RepID=A0ABM0MP63_SACKO
IPILQNCEIRRQTHTGIQEKVALVTGSSDKVGIGLAIAKNLAQRGCSIVLHGSRDADKVEDIREDLQSQYEVPVHYFRADFDKMNEVEGLYNMIEDIYSDGIDILFNNAGIVQNESVDETGIEMWEKTLRVNLTSAFYLTNLSLPGMKRKGWGRVVNISSGLGIKAMPDMCGQVTSKHGMNGLTKTVALETSGTGITCNAICPALAMTEALASSIRSLVEKTGMPFEEIKNSLVTSVNPSGKLLDINKIGEVAAFLCSSSANEITGVILPVDWGYAAK